jgi:Family of unknown function (DUF5681)
MPSAEDQDDPKNRLQSEASTYNVGNKKPPLHTRFKPGQSGNPRGRPKGHKSFSLTLLDEFNKSVSATINGKPSKRRIRSCSRPHSSRMGLSGVRRPRSCSCPSSIGARRLLNRWRRQRRKRRSKSRFQSSLGRMRGSFSIRRWSWWRRAVGNSAHAPRAEARPTIMRNRRCLWRPSGGPLA